jgi:hypothetical protein
MSLQSQLNQEALDGQGMNKTLAGIIAIALGIGTHMAATHIMPLPGVAPWLILYSSFGVALHYVIESKRHELHPDQALNLQTGTIIMLSLIGYCACIYLILTRDWRNAK